MIFEQADAMDEDPQWHSPLFVIEEPENGLYRSLLPALWNHWAGVAPGAQFMMTTHRPYFIDLFDRDLDSVSLIEKEGSVTTAKTLLQFQDTIQQAREHFSLGEQYFKGLFK
jgi:predicted ATPase